jgi:hypothetical protein
MLDQKECSKTNARVKEYIHKWKTQKAGPSSRMRGKVYCLLVRQGQNDRTRPGTKEFMKRFL